MCTPGDEVIDGERTEDAEGNVEYGDEEHAGVFVHTRILSYFLYSR